MPSLEEMRTLVKKSGRHTLREIEKATIEKLANKILRQFGVDIVLLIPAILLLMLEYPRTQGNECNSKLMNWLLAYFGVLITFCCLRLIRIPVLQNSRFYFGFVVVNWILYYLSLFGIFVWGNVIFWHQWSDPVCRPRFWIAQAHTEAYDTRILWSVVGITLALNWIAVIFFVQVCIFVIMLSTFWSQVSRTVLKLASGFTPRALIEQLIETLGEGELQDSLVIGFLQYVLN